MAEYVLRVGGSVRTLQPGWSIQEHANGRNRFDFTILSLDASYRAAIDDPVELKEDGIVIFGGLLDRPVESGLFRGGSTPTYPNPLAFRHGATDYNVYASRIHLTAEIPAGTYKAFLTVVKDALAAQGVTLHASQVDGPMLPALSYVDKPIIDVLNEGASLASGTGATSWVWNIDYTKVLRSIETGTDAAPFNITDVDDGNVLGDITVEQQRSSDFANYIILYGGTGTREVTQPLTFDGIADTFVLDFTLSAHRGYVSNGATNETLDVAGQGATWEYDPVANDITRVTGPPAAGTGEIIYTGQFPKQVIADSGVPAADRVMRTYTEPDVFDLAVMEALAESHLERDSSDHKTIRYAAALALTNLHPGQTQSITKAKRNLSGTFLFTDVTIRSLDARHVQRQITAVSTQRLPRTLREAARQAFTGSDAGSSSGSGVVGTGGIGGSGTAGTLMRWATPTVAGNSAGVATADILNDAVTLAKIQNIATDRVLGRSTAGSGDIEELQGRIIRTGTGHPQGVLAAPVGTYYVDTGNGRVYIKRGGASTAYGWYAVMSSGGVPSDGAAGNLLPYGLIANWNNTATGTATRVYVAGYGWFLQHTTGATIGDSASHQSASGQVAWLDDDLDFVAVVRTGATITDVRYRIGIATALTSGDSQANQVLFRYSTAAGDGGWVGTTRDSGASQTVTSTVAAIAASTIYKLRIRFVRSGTPTVYFSVDDGTEVAVTATIPAAGVLSFFLDQVTTLAASARHLGEHSLSFVMGGSGGLDWPVDPVTGLPGRLAFGNIQEIATATVLGRNTAATGDIEVLTTLPTAVQDNITRLGTVVSGVWNAGAVTSSGAIIERGRSVAMGEWISVAFSAGNFTASGSMTWTVASGDQVTYAYTLVGKTMTVAFNLGSTTVGGTLSDTLRIAIPGGLTAAKSTGGMLWGTDNGTVEALICGVNAGGTVIEVFRIGFVNWTASTDNTTLKGQLTFEVQ